MVHRSPEAHDCSIPSKVLPVTVKLEHSLDVVKGLFQYTEHPLGLQRGWDRPSAVLISITTASAPNASGWGYTGIKGKVGA